MTISNNDPRKDDVRPHDPANPPLAKATTSISQLRPPGSEPSLTRFSLLDATDELEAMALKQKPLLGGISLTTQATVLYGKPNTGKTLIALKLLQAAIRNGRVNGERCFYVAADDNSAGVLEKQKALKPYGVHVIAPGLKEFSTAILSREIEHMTRTGAAQGSFIILDTLKKFADLMDKKNSSAFADLARRYVMAGGSLLGLAHTNKRTDKDGRPIFGGTSDILDDFDCGYTIMALPQKSIPSERVVQFDCIKSRGDVVQQVAYRYSIEKGLSYVELLDTVREVESDELDRVHGEAGQDRDADVIAAIEDCILEGITSKQELKKEGAKRARLGEHKVSAIIDRYTGPDPQKHRWTYECFGHGRREYGLHGQNAPGVTGVPAVDPDKIF